jgi:hypothetical protein
MNNSIKKSAHELNREFSKEEVQMASKYRKKYSTLLVIKEMKIKTALRFYLTAVRMPQSKATTTTNVVEDVSKQEPIHCWEECKLLQPIWKAVWRFLKKLELELPYGPLIPFLSIYPKEPKTGYSRDT